MDDRNQFKAESKQNIRAQGEDKNLRAASINWMNALSPHKYTYNFTWMGLPIIQLPTDIIAMQELIWEVKPDLIIETGIARGGSVVFYASMLELLGEGGKVIGIDIDIRSHNREAIEQHPMSKNIILIQDSSTSDDVIKKLDDYIKENDCKRVLVTLDSNHTHEHVLEELRLYSPFVTKGSYVVVFDTVVEDMPGGSFPDRPWDKGDNPKTAVWEFLKENDCFEINSEIDSKLLISVAPEGYLKRVK
ncbi:MAG: cephalosporin hydroxylase family protein [Defluviitaleaceae bacterium]|nr:cephalosporin hydroxylase family protein [Defluviitaleaceae bacterium]